jgi:hypothetical protein
MIEQYRKKPAVLSGQNKKHTMNALDIITTTDEQGMRTRKENCMY